MKRPPLHGTARCAPWLGTIAALAVGCSALTGSDSDKGDTSPEAELGLWGPVQEWPIVSVHAHLLPTGEVLFWDRGDTGSKKKTPWGPPHIWDSREPERTPVEVSMLGYEPFCAGHTMLSDGRLFVAGGHAEGDYIGQKFASIFDPFNREWTTVEQPMNGGRWYPTTTALANGDVLVIAGSMDKGLVPRLERLNELPQVYEAATGTWRDLTGAMKGMPSYPFMYTAPNGKVFMAGPHEHTKYLDTAGTGAWIPVATTKAEGRDYGSSVMYEPGKVLIVGGSSIRGGILFKPQQTAERIDLLQSNPKWEPAGKMAHGRRMHTATILADGTVLVTGGTSSAGFNDAGGAQLTAELWDPKTNEWKTLSAGREIRVYHSMALLLPDARVLVAGGGLPAPSGDHDHLNAEIFSPPYLFKGARPVIGAAPESIAYGASFDVSVGGAEDIGSVRLIRLGSVTHGFNQGQHAVSLEYQASGDALTARAPENPNMAPPGHYMLFVIANNGAPSEAAIVHLAERPLCAVSFEITAPPDLAQAGERVIITGTVGAPDGGQLGRQNLLSSNSLVLSGAEAPVWRGTRLLPQGATIQYGVSVVAATGESRPDAGGTRTLTVPTASAAERCAIDVEQDWQ